LAERRVAEGEDDVKNILKYLRLGFRKLGRTVRFLRVCFLRVMGVKVGSNCFISLGAKFDMTRGSITVGNGCVITHGCVLAAHDPTVRKRYPDRVGEGNIKLEDNVYVGVNSVILRNVTIGHHAIIGAGAVVTKDVPPYAIVVGNPQRIIRFWGEGTKEAKV
jgi:acetyltransferase-like isoleucine patch superfamily enzyme